jgi:hypothetical protein
LTPAVVALRAQQRATPDPNRWEPAMQKFERQDKEAPTPAGYKIWTLLVRPHLN